MKNFTKFFLSLALMLMALPNVLGAADFTKDGVCYNINSDGISLTVVSSSPKYSGDIVIPSQVMWNNVEYSVTSIGGSAFRGCTGLTSIEIPDGVTSIGGSAFSGCTGLTSVLWNAENCTFIGSYSFQDCAIEKFLFGESVKTIPGNCCYGMNNLTSIEIPNNVTSIGKTAFGGCESLSSIKVSEDNHVYDSRESSNAIIKTNTNELVAGCKSTVIPYGVTSIGYAAFVNCTGLTSIAIPNSVTSIGNESFNGCTGLTSISIPNNVTSVGASAFYGCTGLKSISIPNSVTSVGASAFSGCTGLTSIEIPNSVTSIGGSAFSGCTGLTSILIPDGVTTIGYGAFSGCTGLTSVLWNAENCTWIYSNTFQNCPIEKFLFGESVKTIPGNCCYGMNNLTSIAIPNSVTSIGNESFYGCTGLTSISIPNSVTSVDASAFYGCTRLTSVLWNAENCTSINSNTFQNCAIKKFLFGESVKKIPANCCYGRSNLTSIEIPNSVTSVGASAFYGCTGLTSIEIPNSVTSIGENAFYKCTGLTSIELPNNVTSIESSAFSGCSSLTSVVWNADNCTSINSNTFQDCAIEKFLFGESVKTIPGNCCYGMNNLTSIEIPNSVTSIGENAFYKCTGLTSIELPNNVTSIESSAFSGCYRLKSIEIPNSVTSVGASAFYGCTGLTSIKILNGNATVGKNNLTNCNSLTYIEAPSGLMNVDDYNMKFMPNSVETLIVNGGEVSDNGYNFIKNQIKTLKRLDLGNASAVNIPSESFKNFKRLVYVVLPKNVSSIGSTAFYGCTSLKSISIPNSVTSVGISAFYGCTGLKSVLWNAENCTFIGSYSFQDCAIEKFLFGESVKTIPGNCCYGMNNLTSIEIPNSVTSIGGSAFSGCTGLTSIEIPDGVTSIGGSAFSGCTGLTSIEIPDGVTSIGGSAFSGCTGLTYIEIPNSVTSIGQSAFYDCKGLISITIPNGVTTIEQSVFGGCTGLTSVVWNMENYTSSMRDMFKDCPIEKFTFGESVEIVPENCCYGMKKLTSIEIPSNITTIGGSAFGNCTNLQSIKILNGNATIGKNNLTNCKGLTYIEAPASLIDVAEADMGNVTNSVETLIVNGGEVNENGYKFIDNQRKTIKCLDLSGASNNEIADEAFLDFYKPKFIFLPEGTTSIGYKSFSGCVSLRFARIPSSVTDIEYNAFNDCVGLEYIYCSAETPPTVVSAFTNVDKEIPVYVPCGKVDLYKKAKGWKEFENILCIDEAKQSEEVVAEPTAEPEETSVQLTWAVEHTAGKYVVTVMQDDEVVSILTFDPKGALIDYSTGSSRSASGLRSADANANSFVYTVKGLSKDTEYTYSVEVFDYDGAETEKYVGQFKTLGEVAVDENKFGENVSIKDAVSVFNKTVSVNGYEPSDIRVYNTVGQPVSNPVPASGVYVVKIGGEAVKVMVK